MPVGRLAAHALEAESPVKEWYRRNFDLIAQADALIGAQLANRKDFREHTDMSLCDDVFTVMMKGLSSSENSSVLLLGEAGSGKTHIVEWCLKRLCEVQKSLVVLRAYGGRYATDVECIRHLATQATSQVPAAPRHNASFESGMELIRAVLTDSLKLASAVVIVLDKFEHFCSRARQTLLYNLFDIAQEAGVRLSIIGTSEKMDVMGCLERRIMSRFSMRHLHAFLPTTMDGLLKVLKAKLCLSPECGMKAPFLKELHKNIEAALRAKASHWQAHLELGRPPSWFLGHCLPISALLHETCNSASPLEIRPPAKRLRGMVSEGRLPSFTSNEARMLLLSGLSEVQHIFLLALFRVQNRQATSTLAAVLHEVQRLHEASNFIATWNPDHYCAAFNQLLQMKLIELSGSANGDVGKRHMPCRSLVDHVYEMFIRDLEAKDLGLSTNPLRALPQPVQQWAMRQRPKN